MHSSDELDVMSDVKYARAEPSLLSKAQISALAESVAEQLNFEPCSEWGTVLARLGGKLEVEDTLLQDPEESGSLYVDGPASFRIVVPSHTSPSRDRFTIAHELGHLIVHYLWRRKQGVDVGKMMALRKDSDRVEWEANWFAAAFLMPAASFTQLFSETDGDVSALASAYCVSQAAADVRARSLGLK